eukprot:15433262-Alexandrium_andersonii.AAC.1
MKTVSSSSLAWLGARTMRSGTVDMSAPNLALNSAALSGRWCSLMITPTACVATLSAGCQSGFAKPTRTLQARVNFCWKEGV